MSKTKLLAARIEILEARARAAGKDRETARTLYEDAARFLESRMKALQDADAQWRKLSEELLEKRFELAREEGE